MEKKIYIAGSWKNKNAVKDLMTDLEGDGYSIAVDWTNHKIDENLVSYVQDYLKGLNECSCFIYCMDGIKSIGKNFELGYATALGKPIGIFLMNSKMFGPNIENLPYEKIIAKECSFIRANLYKVLRSIEELKSWLSSILQSTKCMVPVQVI